MQCPECQSTHINKNGHKKANIIIYVSDVRENLQMIIKLKKATPKQ